MAPKDSYLSLNVPFILKETHFSHRAVKEQPEITTKPVCEIGGSQDSSHFAYLWLMSFLREASPPPSGHYG